MLSRSLGSAVRPARGFICLSCLYKETGVPFRFTRIYRRNVSTSNIQSSSANSHIPNTIETLKNEHAASSSPDPSNGEGAGGPAGDNGDAPKVLLFAGGKTVFYFTMGVFFPCSRICRLADPLNWL